MRSRRGAAFSLIELVVASSLLLLVTLLIARLLVPAGRAWLRSEHKATAQQSAMLVVGRLAQECRHALATSLVVTQSKAVNSADVLVASDALSLVSAVSSRGEVESTDQGEVLWQKRMYFYHDASLGALRYHEQSFEKPETHPVPLKVSALERAPDDRVVARNVYALRLLLRPPCTVLVRVESRSDEFATRLESGFSPLLISTEPVILQVPAPTPSTSP